MSLHEYPDVVSLLASPGTAKVLATTGEDGTPHLTFSDDFYVAEDGRLLYLEFEEYSATNRNLVRSIWFSKRLTVQLRSAEGRAFQLHGVPWKALIGGPLYEQYYVLGRQQGRPTGLSTVWVINVDHVSDETPAVRALRDGDGRIPLVHLDSIAR